jgi:hypothetical protein
VAHLDRGGGRAQLDDTWVGRVFDGYIYLGHLRQGWQFFSPNIPREATTISVREVVGWRPAADGGTPIYAPGALHDGADRSNKPALQVNWDYGTAFVIARTEKARRAANGLDDELARFVRWVGRRDRDAGRRPRELQLLLTRRTLGEPFDPGARPPAPTQEVILSVKDL